MVGIELQNIRKRYSSQGPWILDDISLKVSPGEFLVLVGPSGCGKSTLLRCIAGLEEIDSGDILFDGVSVRNLEPQKRNLSMVFQSYALYPHMSVAENLGFGLKLVGTPSKELNLKVQEAAELLQIDQLLERHPKELSGGQRQRVALGRALVKKPPLILFDEPLSNLDAHLRSQMRLELKTLHQRLKTTMIYVTHDQVEAITLGDRLAVLQKGKIAQLGSPTEVYAKPNSEFVAGFIGAPEINLWLHPDNPKFRIGVRPEHLGLEATLNAPKTLAREALLNATKSDAIHAFANRLEDQTAQVMVMENHGSQTLVHLDWQGEKARALLPSDHPTLQKLHPKGFAKLIVKPEHLHYFLSSDGSRTSPA